MLDQKARFKYQNTIKIFMTVRLHGDIMPTGETDCPYCGRGFWNDRDLELHLLNDHKRPMGTRTF